MEDKLTKLFPLSTSSAVSTLVAKVPSDQVGSSEFQSINHFIEDFALREKHLTVTEPVVECLSEKLPGENNFCEAQFAVCHQPDTAQFEEITCNMGSKLSGEEKPKPQCPAQSGDCNVEQVAGQPEGQDTQPVDNSPREAISTIQCSGDAEETTSVQPCGSKTTDAEKMCYIRLERMNLSCVNDGTLNLAETPSLSTRRVKFGTVVYGKIPAPSTPQKSILKTVNATDVPETDPFDDESGLASESFSGSRYTTMAQKSYCLRDRAKQMHTGTCPTSFDQNHLQLRCSLRLLHKSHSPSYVANEETAESALAEDVAANARRLTCKKRKLFPSDDDLVPSHPKRLFNGSNQFCAMPLDEPASHLTNGTPDEPSDIEAEVKETVTEMVSVTDEEVEASSQHLDEPIVNYIPNRKVRPPSLLGDCFVSLRQMDVSSLTDGSVVLSEEMLEKLSDKRCKASQPKMPSQEFKLELDDGVEVKVEDDTSTYTPILCLTPASARIMKLIESVTRGKDAVEKLKGK